MKIDIRYLLFHLTAGVALIAVGMVTDLLLVVLGTLFIGNCLMITFAQRILSKKKDPTVKETEEKVVASVMPLRRVS